ncbi:MAG: hypothetical protein V3V29_01580 [Acidimicrobiia bacterium]
MRLVVIDLIPALLSWEGRDRSADPEIAPDGPEAVAHLYSHYRVMGLADAGVAGETLRRSLEAAGIAEYFESIGTSAGFGPEVTPRIVRRIGRMARAKEGVIVVTGRPRLARAISRSRTGVVFTNQEEFGAVPEAVASLIAGRVSP